VTRYTKTDGDKAHIIQYRDGKKASEVTRIDKTAYDEDGEAFTLRITYDEKGDLVRNGVKLLVDGLGVSSPSVGYVKTEETAHQNGLMLAQ